MSNSCSFAAVHSSAPSPPPAAASRSAGTCRPTPRSRRGGQRGARHLGGDQPDDTTIVRIARSEMGQGTLTGLAQLVADELDCDWKHVRAEYVVAGRQPREQARLGRHVHRRQPRHPRLGGLCAQGRRGRARHADRGRGAALGRAGSRMHRGGQRRSPTRRAAARCATARSPPMPRSCPCRPR